MICKAAIVVQGSRAEDLKLSAAVRSNIDITFQALTFACRALRPVVIGRTSASNALAVVAAFMESWKPWNIDSVTNLLIIGVQDSFAGSVPNE